MRRTALRDATLELRWLHSTGLLVVAFVLGLYLGALLLLGVVGSGWDEWRHFGVPPWTEPFSDMWSITSGWECVRQGLDVVPHNPCDPWGRYANYPTMWMLPAPLGLAPGSAPYLGAAMAVAFFAAALLLAGSVSWRGGAVFALALCSPPIMLGVERGNVDLLIFAALVGAVWLLSASSALWRVAAQILLLVLAALKLFPVFAFPVLLRQRGGFALAGTALVSAGFAVYLLGNAHEIREILDVVPQYVWAHYGAGVVVDAAAERSAQHVGPLSILATGWVNQTVEVGVLVLGGAAALLLVLDARRRPQLRAETSSRRERFEGDAFVAGAGIFCGTFAVIENWDYRLAFLLLALPQLLRWAGQPRERAPLPFAATAIVCMLGSLWLSLPVPSYSSWLNGPWTQAMAYFAWEELLNLLLFAYLLAGMVVLIRPARPADGVAVSRVRPAREMDVSPRPALRP